MGKRRSKDEGQPSKAVPEEAAKPKPTVAPECPAAYIELIGLLMQRADVTAWLYDAPKDTLYFRSPKDNLTHKFKDLRMSSASEEWQFLWHGETAGTADAHAPFWHEEAVYRLTYRYVPAAGETYVVGIAEDITEVHAAAMRLKESAALSGSETIGARIEAELALLRPREKGVLFALEIDGLAEMATQQAREASIRVMEDTLRAEFRGNDIFGRLEREGRYIVFFCGSLSIDVVERRAQHFLDEYQRRALDTSLTATCSLGIAVTGDARADAGALISASNAALNEAILRGSHHYRMFDGNRY